MIHGSINKRIEIITTATKMPEVAKRNYKAAFKRLKYPTPGFLEIQDKIEAQNPKYLETLKSADVVVFTGGDQFRLSTILGGTPIMELIREKYYHQKDFIIAGTSAGAMAMSSIMITSGGREEALFEMDLKISSGLGLLHNCIIDTHFIKRGRFSRLAHAVIINPCQLGIGLGEDTALIIKNGSDAECRGSGMVVIIDGDHIAQTNMATASEQEALFVENLIVHLLVKGCRFSIKNRKLMNPAISRKYKSLPSDEIL